MSGLMLWRWSEFTDDELTSLEVALSVGESYVNADEELAADERYGEIGTLLNEVQAVQEERR